MISASIIVVYVFLHFSTYAVALRHRSGLQNESGIFRYHAFSYVLLLGLVAVATCAIPGQDLGAGLVLAAGVHGIYSLSFLEVWSLTQGSYSLGILAHVHRLGGSARAPEIAQLKAVGSSKQAARTEDLIRLGVVRSDGRLTWLGVFVAAPLRTILWLANGKTMN